jgi:hypothetical protein
MLWELEHDRALPWLVNGVAASFVTLAVSIVARSTGRKAFGTVLALLGPLALLLTVLLLAPHRSAYVFDVVSGESLADATRLWIAAQGLSEALIAIHFAALAAGVLFQATALGVAITASSSGAADTSWATRGNVVAIGGGVLGMAIAWLGLSPAWGYLAAVVVVALVATLVGVLLLLRSERTEERPGSNEFLFVANGLCALLCFGAAVRFRAWHWLFRATGGEALRWEDIGPELTKWSETLASFDKSSSFLLVCFGFVLAPVLLRTKLRAALCAESLAVFGVVGVFTLGHLRVNNVVPTLMRIAERIVPVELSPPKVDARYVSRSEGRTSLDAALLVGRDRVVFRGDRPKELVEVATRSRFSEPDCHSLFSTLPIVHLSIVVDRSTSYRDVICLFAGLESRNAGAYRGQPGDYPWGILGGPILGYASLKLRFAAMLDTGEPPAPFDTLGRKWFDFDARTAVSKAPRHLHLTPEAWFLDLEGRTTPIDATSKDRVTHLSAAVKGVEGRVTLSADPPVTFQDFLDAAVVVSRGELVISLP